MESGAFVPAHVHGRTLHGLSVNLVVRDVGRSTRFLRDGLGLRVLFEDGMFAAATGAGAWIMLHQDAASGAMPAVAHLPAEGPRGGGVEIRLLGIDPDWAAARAPEHGGEVRLAPRDFPHGWREAHLADPDGYLFAVGIPVGSPDAVPSGVRLRPLRGEDAAKVLAVIDDWWGGRRMREHLPRLFFEHFGTSGFAAEDAGSGELLGFLCGIVSEARPGESYIHFAGVAPGARHRGVARALYRAFFALARARGCTSVGCVTSPVNANSVAFHRRMGFALVPGDAEEGGFPVHTGLEGPGTMRVVMRRELGPED